MRQFFILLVFTFLFNAAVAAPDLLTNEKIFQRNTRQIHLAGRTVTQTPNYETEDLLLLMDWHNPVTTQGVANAGFTDRSTSGYNMTALAASAGFKTDPSDYCITLNGSSDYVSGSQIQIGEALSISTAFTVLTMLKHNTGSTGTMNIISRIGGPGQLSMWQIVSHWEAPVGKVAFMNVQFPTNPPGQVYDYIVQCNTYAISNNVSNQQKGSALAVVYDFANLTVNVLADYDEASTLIDGVLATLDMTEKMTSTNTAIEISNQPILIGAEDVFVPTRYFNGTMGPLAIYRGRPSLEVIDRFFRWAEFVTRWNNG